MKSLTIPENSTNKFAFNYFELYKRGNYADIETYSGFFVFCGEW